MIVTLLAASDIIIPHAIQAVELQQSEQPNGAAEFGGFFHGSRLRRGRLILAPHTSEGGLDLLLETLDQLAVGGDQRLLGFDLCDNGSLRVEGWEGDSDG